MQQHGIQIEAFPGIIASQARTWKSAFLDASAMFTMRPHYKNTWSLSQKVIEKFGKTLEDEPRCIDRTKNLVQVPILGFLDKLDDLNTKDVSDPHLCK